MKANILSSIFGRKEKNRALESLKNKNEFLELQLARLQENSFVKITERQQFLFKKDLQAWQQAHQEAISVYRPRRHALMEVYADAMLDTFLSGKIQTRLLNVLNTPFKVVNQEQERQDTETNLLNRKWFFEVLREIMLSIFYGYSVLELHFDLQGKVSYAKSFPRENCLPDKDALLPDVYGETLVSIANNPNYLRVYQNDLGLLLKATPYTILKRHAKAFWSRFQELFGIPFRHAKYSGNDSRIIDTLYRNLQEMGSAAFGVFPQGVEIGFLENSKSDAYSVFLEAIKQANEEISQLVLGVPANQDASGSFARDKVSYEKEGDISYADLRFVQFVVNDELLPLLSQWGYDFEGLQFVFEPSWQLPLASNQLEVDKWIAEHYEIDENYITETYGVPVKKKILASQNQQDNATGLADTFFWAKLDKCCHNEPIALGQSVRLKEIIEQIIEKIYKGELLDGVIADLPLTLQKQLLEALQKEFTNTPAWQSPENEWLVMQSNNIYAFSAAKSFAQLVEMRDLVFENGKIRPFTEFRADALKIHQKYNEDWLQTEYNAVVRGSVMGKKWLNVQANKDIYPYLRYETAGDSRVREAHQKLNGVILPVDSPFWDTAFPPNGWNCRCTVKQLRKDQVSEADKDNVKQNEATYGKIAKDTTPEYWRKNIGKTEIFEQNDTVYFKALPKGKLLDAEKHYNLPSIEKIYQKGNLPPMQTQNKADYQSWWDGLLVKYKGNKQKNYFDIETDLGGVKLPIRFDNDFFKHIQKEERETWINNLEDILQNPSEVWATYDFDSKNTPESLHVFKFYKFEPVVLNIELVKNNWVAQTIFINNKNDYATFKKRRKGLLIVKKQE